VYENTTPFALSAAAGADPLAGVSGFPPVLGYVLSTRKQNQLVETLLEAPLPANAQPEHRTVLSQWRYGLGKTAVFATDVGTRWATNWTAWPDYDRFFAQLVRSIMRPSGETGRYSLNTQRRDGRIEIVVDAQDAEKGFLNFQSMTAVVVGAGKAEVERVRLQQTSPGRYVGDFAAEEAGDYVVSVLPAPGESVLRTGASIPYSDEFRPSPPNRPLLESLAALAPDGGTPGEFFSATEGTGAASSGAAANLSQLATDHDVFRRDLRIASTRLPGWHWVLLAAACLFFVDVAVRRVWFEPGTIRAFFARLVGRKAVAAEQRGEYFDRLKRQKAEATREVESTRARFETKPPREAFRDPLPSEATFDEIHSGGRAPNREAVERPPAGLALTPQGEAEDYASRLLKAKRAALKRRDDESPA
ncbi:MAG TPA: hypothetical protein VGE52_13920, partial [Pirellulales bacterium]